MIIFFYIQFSINQLLFQFFQIHVNALIQENFPKVIFINVLVLTLFFIHPISLLLSLHIF